MTAMPQECGMLGGALEGTQEVPDKTRACNWRAERRDTFGARVFLDAFTEASFLLQSSWSGRRESWQSQQYTGKGLVPRY